MTGFRKESFYIEKFGTVIGTKKYQLVLASRESRKARRSASTTTIKCLICNKQFKRITKSHLKFSCINSITTEEYLTKFPDAILISAELKSLYKNTKESITEKYGDARGNEKWNSYIEIQAETNSLEYKAANYNLTANEFVLYNKARASTLKNFVNRHGEEVGIEKWNTYCTRQQYTTTIEYFVEKYGVELGEEKWEHFYLGRINSPVNRISNSEQEVYNTLINSGLKLIQQYSIRTGRTFVYDFANLEKRILIEYNGDMWHMNPNFYKADDIQCKTGSTAQEIWDKDERKRNTAITAGFKIYTIWATDWKINSQQIIEDIKNL